MKHLKELRDINRDFLIETPKDLYTFDKGEPVWTENYKSIFYWLLGIAATFVFVKGPLKGTDAFVLKIEDISPYSCRTWVIATATLQGFSGLAMELQGHWQPGSKMPTRYSRNSMTLPIQMVHSLARELRDGWVPPFDPSSIPAEIRHRIPGGVEEIVPPLLPTPMETVAAMDLQTIANLEDGDDSEEEIEQLFIPRSDVQHLQHVTDRPGKFIPEAHFRHSIVCTLTSCSKVLGYFESLAPANVYCESDDLRTKHPLCAICATKKPAVTASFKYLELSNSSSD
jgi:hypothetical protein